MFETAELGRTVTKQRYNAKVPALRTDLLRLQNELRERPFPVILLVNGVDGAGKGETVNLLHEWMDPRYLETYAFGPMSDEERERPPMWRFWRVLPPHGRIGIFFGSWYTDPILDRTYERIDDAAFDTALQRINVLEKELVDDGTLIVKFWMHLSKRAQKERLTALEANRKTRWRVTRADWKHFRMYDSFRRVSTRALRATSTGEAPWLVVEGADHRYRGLTVGGHLLKALTRRLERVRPASRRSPERAESDPVTVFDRLDLTMTVPEKQYGKQLETWQGRLNVQSRKAKKRGISTVIVCEGWDAAGKGGLIRRITAALDARDYRVIPIAAPTDEEKAHHYLWRFWRHLPRGGRFTIFDRSWYGRVLVERVEGFATEDEWMRAYAEINNFEEQLAEHGTAVVKLWLHIDKDEQLRRFSQREKTPYKQFKITDDDYRNRERWRDYELAANEMVARTSTEYAPWTLIEANDKRHARLKALETVCTALKTLL